MKKIILLFTIFFVSNSYSQVGINTTSPTATLDVNGNTRIRTIPETTATNSATSANFIYPIYADINGNLVYPYDWSVNPLSTPGLSSFISTTLNTSMTTPIDILGSGCSKVFVHINDNSSFWVAEFLVSYSETGNNSQWSLVKSSYTNGGATNTDTVTYNTNLVSLYRSGGASGYSLELIPSTYNASTGAGAQIKISRIGFSSTTIFVLRTEKIF